MAKWSGLRLIASFGGFDAKAWKIIEMKTIEDMGTILCASNRRRDCFYSRPIQPFMHLCIVHVLDAPADNEYDDDDEVDDEYTDDV